MAGAVKRITTNYNFVIPNFDIVGWGASLERNFDVIDAVLYAFTGFGNLRGAWTNSAVYAVGDRAVDSSTGTIWQCLLSHTADATGTFADSRAAHPTYWFAITSTSTYRGTWTTATVYNSNEFVSSGFKYGVCVSQFTSGASYAADVAAGKIITLIDLQSAYDSSTTAATNAANSATAAANSATSAANSATSASGSAGTATSAATAAGTSATNAANSATNAGTQATNAATSATNAANSATAAANSASSAATQATNASSSANAANTSATNAANSATAASNSATSAQSAVTTVMQSAVPLGVVLWHSLPSVPDGFLICDGTGVSALYPDYRSYLIAAGSPYGTDGNGDPRRPQLLGEFIRGWDNGRGVDTGRVFGSAQASQNLAHTHGVTDPGHAHSYTEGYVTGTLGGSLTGSPGYFYTRTSATTTVATGISIQSNGGTEARPRNVAMLPIVKAFGAISITGMANLSALLNAIATQAEAETGVDNTKIMTPLRTKQAIVISNKAYIHVRDQKASGTEGGAASAGVNVRTLNTLVYNGITGASLASNQVTLPAGTYLVWARSPMYATNRNCAWLRTSSGTVLAYGSSGYAWSSGACYDSIIQGTFTLAATTAVEIAHYCTTANVTNGLGVGGQSGTIPEVYADMIIAKVD